MKEQLENDRLGCFRELSVAPVCRHICNQSKYSNSNWISKSSLYLRAFIEAGLEEL